MFISVKRKVKPEKEKSIYSKEIREKMLEDGALSVEEDGFMEGYAEDRFVDDHDLDDDDDEEEMKFSGSNQLEKMY